MNSLSQTDPQPAPLDQVQAPHWSPSSGRPYAEAPGARYLLPTTLLAHGGIYEYVLIDVAQARQWLLAGPCQSFLTHPMLHAALETIIGFLTPPPCRGPLPPLGYHDDAMIFQVQSYETLPQQLKGSSERIKRLIAEERWTLGLLRRLT